MKTRRQDLQIFSLSFLDVAFCALGGTLLILLFSINRHEEAVGFFKTTSEKMSGEIEAERKKIGGLVDELNQAREHYADLEEKHEDAKRRSAEEAERGRENLAKLKNDANAKIAELEKDLLGAKDALKAANEESNLRQNAYDKAKRDYEKRESDLKSKVANLETALAKMTAGIAMTDKRLTDSERDNIVLRESGREVLGKLKAGEREIAQLRSQLQGIVGLKGPMKNVAFIFDTSDSMTWLITPTGTEKSSPIAIARFAEYKALLASWVEHLSFDAFTIVTIGDKAGEVPDWAGKLAPGDAEHRRVAVEFVKALDASGSTNTMAALKLTLEQMEGVDTVVLFSDGAPNDEQNRPVRADSQEAIIATTRVLDYLRTSNRDANGRPTVVINTIAMGEYLNAIYGKFLQDMAKENGGVFIGR